MMAAKTSIGQLAEDICRRKSRQSARPRFP
jgi:hypothetical protein